MRIGELAKRTGLTVTRIRFYEAAGLLRGVERTANGYRRYSPDAVATLEVITGAQAAGFSLDQVRTLLPSGSGKWRHEELLEALRRKLAEVEAMQNRLAQARAQLEVAITGIESKPDDLACTANAQRVLEQIRLVAGPHRPSPEPPFEGDGV